MKGELAVPKFVCAKGHPVVPALLGEAFWDGPEHATFPEDLAPLDPKDQSDRCVLVRHGRLRAAQACRSTYWPVGNGPGEIPLHRHHFLREDGSYDFCQTDEIAFEV